MPTSNTHNGSPRFRQIVDGVRASINKSTLKEHAPVPSERILAEQYGVSRMTARRALEALEVEGVIYSEERRGRFMSPKRLPYNVNEMVSFANDAKNNDTTLEIEVIERRTVNADGSTATKLGVPRGETLFEYTRLFRADGHPIFVETECVIANRFPNFFDNNLAQSTTALIETAYGTITHAGDILIKLCTVSEREACLLGLMPYRAAIELQQIIFDDDNKPFCVGRQIWRGERAQFHARAVVGSAKAIAMSTSTDSPLSN